MLYVSWGSSALGWLYCRFSCVEMFLFQRSSPSSLAEQRGCAGTRHYSCDLDNVRVQSHKRYLLGSISLKKKKFLCVNDYVVIVICKLVK